MFCPSCGKENAESGRYCNSCGRELTPVPAAAPAVTPSAASAPASATYASSGSTPFQTVSEPRKSNSVLIIIGLLVVLGAGVAGVLTHRAQIGRLFNTETPEQLVGRLMREAAGVQPVHESFFSDREFDNAFRDQFRKVIQVNQEYMARINQLDTSQIAKVGTPESFADPAYAAEGIRQMHASLDLDRELEQKLQEIVAGLRQTFDKTSWSASDRAAAQKGFDVGFAKVMGIRTRVINGEQGYVNAMDDVYKFAGDHHDGIQMVSGNLQILDEAVLQEFNSKIHAYNARRSEFMQAKQEFDRYQSDLMNKVGVTPKDAGLQ